MSGTGDGHPPCWSTRVMGGRVVCAGGACSRRATRPFPRRIKKASRGPDADRIQGGEAFSFDIQTGLLRLAQNRKQQNNNWRVEFLQPRTWPALPGCAQDERFSYVRD